MEAIDGVCEGEADDDREDEEDSCASDELNAG
jgi:hypothetical protein